MEEVDRLHRRWTEYVASLLAESTMDEQFMEILKLQDESNPNFVFDIFSLFFQTSAELIEDTSKILEKTIVNFDQVVSNLHKLRGSSQSVGALKMRNACIAFRTCCEAKDAARCRQCLQTLRNEREAVKKKMESVFELEAKVVAAGGTVPTFLLKKKNEDPDVFF